MTKKKEFQVQNRECFSRINFLLQAANLMSQSIPEGGAASDGAKLARFYSRTLRGISRRLVLRLYVLWPKEHLLRTKLICKGNRP